MRPWYTVSTLTISILGDCADIIGTFGPLETADDIYAYTRTDSTINQKLLVILNFARGSNRRGEAMTFEVPKDMDVSGAKLLIANNEGLQEGSGIEGGKLELGKYEGRIYLL
jgi:alpha-glucosidase